MTRVMVTGAAGQLGSTTVARLSVRYEVFPFTRAELDLALAPSQAQVAELRLQGMSYRDIARHFGVSKSQVARLTPVA